jgi:hypothetical protein
LPSQINASNSGFGGIVSTGDSSGVLELQTVGTTAVTIDTSQRVGFVAGTAAAPAITRTGDTNTGMFFPAADTIAFAEGGTEAMRLDSVGNVGIGVTPSPSVLSGKVLEIGFSGGNANMFQNNVDDWWFSSNAYYNGTSWVYNKTGTISQYHMFNGTHVWLNQVSGTAGTSASAPVERMLIDSSGNVLIGMSGVSATGARMDVAQQTNCAVTGASFAARQATSGNQYGIFTRLNGDPNNTVNYFFRCNGGATERATIRSNGGLANFSANNVNLASDYRLKNTIEPVKDYWNTFKNIEWKTWLYNDQTDDIKNIGVIAQELQTLAPELVCESNAVETPEDESPYLGIWENDFKMAGLSVITQLIKKTEEQQTIINDLKARIETLEAK